MEHADAVAFLRSAGIAPAGRWADLGAGDGTFSRALAELLGPEGLVFAVDRSERVLAIRSLPNAAPVRAVRADFTRGLSRDPPWAADTSAVVVPSGAGGLDGILMANALHYAGRQQSVLANLVALLRPGGSFLLVEYDGARASPWIPFPLPWERYRALALRAGLVAPRRLARRPSRFGGRELYLALARAPAAAGDARRPTS